MSILKNITILWLLLGFFFTSCTQVNGKSETIPTPSSTIGVTASATPTGTPKPVLPSATPIILQTIPTLPESDAYHLLLDLLHADETCELPCWLNITPGRSTLLDVNLSWGGLEGITTTYSDPLSTGKGNLDFDYEISGHDIYINTSYYLLSGSEVIKSISVSTRTLGDAGNGNRDPVYTLGDYKDTVHDYLLPNILSTYGLPIQIFLSMEIISAEPTSPDFFHIWLLYPASGAIIEYTGSAQVNDNIINGCPTDTFVSLWLVSPNDLNLYQKTLKDITGADWNDLTTASPFYKSTMDAIGIATNEFYETYKTSTTSCIKSPLNIWPQH